MNTLDTQPDTELAAMLANMTFNADELACLRDDSGEYDEPPGKVTINKEIGLAENLKVSRRAKKRITMNLTHVANAANHIEKMPRKGWSIHALAKGNYSAWDTVPATLRLEYPDPIKQLHIATLSFNKNITESLDSLLKSKQVDRVRLVCSHYYASMEPEAFEEMSRMLKSHGQKIMASRTHAKIICMKMSGDRHYVLEGSANSRSCRNSEQFCLSNDRNVWTLYRDWMEKLCGDESSVKIDHDSARAED